MSDHAPLLERAFALRPGERAYEVEAVEGEIPEFIRGSYYLAGPALFRHGDVAYRHWLDGDGMVCRLRFNRGRAHFANAFVRSEKWVAEADAGRALFRAFGTRFPGDRLKRGIALEPPVNVSAYCFDGHLLAFGEQGLPWALDPDTLKTREKYTFHRKLNDISPFSAHPKIDPVSGELFNFGVSFAGARPLLTLYRFDAAGGLLSRHRLPLGRPCSIHDFGLGPRHVCVYAAPYLLSMAKLAREGATLMESLEWRPELGTRLMIVDRASGELSADLAIGNQYCLHFINVWEAGDRLMVDLLELDEPVYDEYEVIPDLFKDVSPGRPVRYEIDTTTWRVAEKRTLDYELAPDFAAIDPRKQQRAYDEFWMLGIGATGQPGRKFFDQLVHCRWNQGRTEDIYQAPAHAYLGGEPIFLPDPDSERGAIICQLFDADLETSYFLLFDATRVSAGPLARLRLEEPLPPLFHASYNPA